ncbi:MAG: isoprenoid biosynthesis protein ElbB [Paludibacterium sp.]|uniref:isoprenoid biosynthesis protein ElbB n=1 Tax=Paludibacterium sp. TaxID=1917523 RepID=UPI0025EE6331|nr:isoprenoid biosynthesis protein ElbB [Paludibacterium sp.]MBV8046360.1 isoprenoid biosynthesis protein ElbB [Paludibacterium sp.]MBV8645813.1 isoprenoid biosynthesis protein ElbB [Paludibacterium sp.]
MIGTPTIALVLCGCGIGDGSDVLEAAGSLIALSQEGCRVRCFAPSRAQREVIDHASGRAMQDARHMLIESARLTRGVIEPLSELDPVRLDAVLLPGGGGVLRNLTNFAVRGAGATLAPDVLDALMPVFLAGRPFVALGPAALVPALLARELGRHGARLTFGHEDEAGEYIDALEAWGLRHVECALDEACIDDAQRIVSVPAGLYAKASPADLFGAAQAAVSAMCWLLAQQEGG